MRGSLSARIEQATLAQTAIAEQKELEDLAEGLADLQAEAELEEQLTRAEENLRGVVERCKTELPQAAQKATDWRERFSKLAAEAEALVGEMPRIQHQIFGPLQALQRAVENVNAVGWKAARPGGDEAFSRGTGLATRTGRAASFERLLEECGGLDPGLSVFPDFDGDPRRVVASLPWRLREFLRRGRGVIYDPAAGSRNLTRR